MSSKRRLWQEIRKYKFAYIWIAPFFVLFGIFKLFPFFFSVYISLHKWSGLGVPQYIALSNFMTLFSDTRFWMTLKNTLIIWLIIVPFRTFLALIIAYILNLSFLKLKYLFRTAILLPYMTSFVIAGVIFRVILASPGGWANFVLGLFSIESIPWLRSPIWSKPAVSLLNMWRGTGYFTLIMLAGLQRIPPELYEAAAIDGANKVKSFFRITIPLMVPIGLFVIVISTIWLSRMTVGPLVLTNGGPNLSSTTLGLFLLSEGFENFKLGYAATIGIVMFGIFFVFSYFQLRIFSRE